MTVLCFRTPRAEAVKVTPADLEARIAIAPMKGKQKQVGGALQPWASWGGKWEEWRCKSHGTEAAARWKRINRLEEEGGRRRSHRKRKCGTCIMMIVKLRQRCWCITAQLSFDSIHAHYLPFLKRVSSASPRGQAPQQSRRAEQVCTCSCAHGTTATCPCESYTAPSIIIHLSVKLFQTLPTFPASFSSLSASARLPKPSLQFSPFFLSFDPYLHDRIMVRGPGKFANLQMLFDAGVVRAG